MQHVSFNDNNHYNDDDDDDNDDGNNNNNYNNNNNTTTTTNNNNRTERCNLRFFTISSLHRELPPTHTLKWSKCNRVQITCNTSSAYHVQRVMCHLVQTDSSAIKFDIAEIAFIQFYSIG